MARPRKGDEGRYAPITIRLSSAAFERLRLLADHYDTSMYALSGRIVERVLSQQISRVPGSSWYGDRQSTLSGVLSGSLPSPALRVAPPSLGR